MKTRRRIQWTKVGKARSKAAFIGESTGATPREARAMGTFLNKCEDIWKVSEMPRNNFAFIPSWPPLLKFVTDKVELITEKAVKEVEPMRRSQEIQR
jgi:hypothetical protein